MGQRASRGELLSGLLLLLLLSHVMRLSGLVVLRQRLHFLLRLRKGMSIDYSSNQVLTEGVELEQYVRSGWKLHEHFRKENSFGW